LTLALSGSDPVWGVADDIRYTRIWFGLIGCALAPDGSARSPSARGCIFLSSSKLVFQIQIIRILVAFGVGFISMGEG
jgi:hypothetical protein